MDSGDISLNLRVNCKVLGPHLEFSARKSRQKILDLIFTITPGWPPPDWRRTLHRFPGAPGPAVPLARCPALSYRPRTSQDQKLQDSLGFQGGSTTRSHLINLSQAFPIFTARQSTANL